MSIMQRYPQLSIGVLSGGAGYLATKVCPRIFGDSNGRGVIFSQLLISTALRSSKGCGLALVGELQGWRAVALLVVDSSFYLVFNLLIITDSGRDFLDRWYVQVGDQSLALQAILSIIAAYKLS